jgi:hypothetical protein
VFVPYDVYTDSAYRNWESKRTDSVTNIPPPEKQAE